MSSPNVKNQAWSMKLAACSLQLLFPPPVFLNSPNGFPLQAFYQNYLPCFKHHCIPDIFTSLSCTLCWSDKMVDHCIYRTGFCISHCNTYSIYFFLADLQTKIHFHFSYSHVDWMEKHFCFFCISCSKKIRLYQISQHIKSCPLERCTFYGAEKK